jgi:hypothetical protein
MRAFDIPQGTIKLKASVDHRDGVWFANQFVNVRLLNECTLNRVAIKMRHIGGAAFALLACSRLTT